MIPAGGRGPVTRPNDRVGFEKKIRRVPPKSSGLPEGKRVEHEIDLSWKKGREGDQRRERRKVLKST